MTEHPIRTPDQRLRIFVSSTLAEMADERRAAREAIERLRLTPVMFELGARPHPPRSLYRAYLEQSDVFIGLYAERYGWVAPGEDVSGLEDEYRLAGDRPRLIYLKEPAPEREPRLTSLLDSIRADDRASYRRFADADELRELIADDLAVLLTERFATSSDPPTATPGGRRALPQPLTRLIGREAEIQRVAGLLTEGDRRLITLTGPGGIGKTRLAIAVAERVTDRFDDGVAFIPLSGLDEPSLLIPTIAEGLGVREGSGMSIGLSLTHALGDAQLLLVLDNFEQLVDAAPALADVLVGAPHVRMLVTSRSVLNISGEQVVDVPPLEEPVELFVDRVRSLDATSTPSADDLDAFSELGRRLDALPLAIELASAQLRILRPRQLLDRLGNRPVAHLASGSRDLPARQQTLHDTIAWSHGLLPPDAQRLFERLSVFVGGATVDAIERVASPDGDLDVLTQLGTLVDHSLVRRIGDAPEPRYGMLQTVREFAVGRLEARGEDSATRARHTAYFGAMADEGAIGIGGSGQLEWIDRFALEADNFRAVLRRAIRAGDATSAARIGVCLSAYWQMRSLFTEGRGWMRAVEEMPTANPHDRAVAWTAGGMLAFWQGDVDALETGVDEAIATLRDADDARALGFAELLRYLVLGAADVSAASVAPSDSSASLETQDDPFLRAVGLLARAYVARLGGDLAAASTLAQAAAQVSADTDEYYIRGVASTLLAGVALDLDDRPSVRAHAIDGLLASQKLRNLASAGYALELWSAAELRDGRTERAGRLYALAVKAWGMASAQPWRSERHLHREIIEGLERALGEELPTYVDAARELDLDDAVTELATSQPE